MTGKSNGSGYRTSDWVWGLDLPSTQKLVMLAIAKHSDATYTSYPKMSVLARETGLGRSTVARAIAGLEAADLILRAARLHGHGGNTSNRYYINHPDAPHVTGELDNPVMLAEVQQAARRAIGEPSVGEGLDPEVIARERRTGLVPEGAADCARCDGTGYVDGVEACDHGPVDVGGSRSETRGGPGAGPQGVPERDQGGPDPRPPRGTNPLTNPLTNPQRTELSPEPGTSLRAFARPERNESQRWEEVRGA